MNGNKVNLVSVLTAILVGVGALLSSFATYLSVLWGISAMPRSIVLQDPIGWALRPAVPPLAIIGMLLVLVLLMGLTWIFVRLIVASALPGRGAAVFFGTWGALIVASMIAGVVRAIIMMVTLNIPSENSDLLLAQFQQFSFITATWAVTWGWIVALVAALIHRSTSTRQTGTYVPQQQYAPAQQRPQAQQYAPAQPHVPTHQQQAQQQQYPQPPQPPQDPGHSA